jgi:hypothetical protein
MLTMTLTGLDEAKKKLGTMARQLPFATKTALNAVAYDARKAVIAEMGSVFDRPTPYVLSGVFVREARKDNLVAEVYMDFFGKGKGVAPEKVLLAEVFGGARRNKRAEVALQRVGLMLPDQVLVPGEGAPLDAYGNVPGSFIVRLLSYFQAFGEQGYKANMTQRNRQKLSGRGRWVNGKFVPAYAKGYDPKAGAKAQRRGGVEYFVSHGKGERNGRRQHLPAGIYERRGLHGEDIRPVLMFVKRPVYSKRLPFFDTVRTTVERQWPVRLDAALDQAMSTAR